MAIHTVLCRSSVTHLLGLLTAFVAAGSSDAKAQCPLQPSALGGGVSGLVFALAPFDADGAGPAPTELYSGGGVYSTFRRWNGSAWSSDGEFTCAFCQHPSSPHVNELIVLDDDGPGPNPPALFAGGLFSGAPGTVATFGVARFDGAEWTNLGTGCQDLDNDLGVDALAIFDDDGSGPNLPALYAGGDFNEAGGVPIARIAKWDGSSWSPLGSGMNDAVFAITSFDDDGAGPHPAALYAGGWFGTAGGVNARGIARWDGVSWSDVGGGLLLGDFIDTLTVFDDDGAGPHLPVLIAGGYFSTIGGVSAENMAQWDGSSWSALGSGTNSNVLASAVFDDDGPGPIRPALYVGGPFTAAGGVGASYLARWDGTSWSAVGSGTNDTVFALAAADLDGSGLVTASLYSGGSFSTAGGVSASRVASWAGCGSSVEAFCVGDGVDGPCPCGNTGLLRRGCNNSAGTGGALLSASGTASLAEDTFTLDSSGELPSALSVFLQGRTKIAATSYGDGLRCTGGALRRLYVKNASSGTVVAPQVGEPSISSRSAERGDPLIAGATRHYQVFYRDPTSSFCPSPAGNTFNISNGRSVSWGP